MLYLPVTCMVLFHQGKLFAAQRSQGMELPGMWEFPGGKVEPREDPQACLVREIQEELAVGIELLLPLTPVKYCYPSKNILLLPFLASWKSGKVLPQEHSQVAWLEKGQLFQLAWAPADLPVVKEVDLRWEQFIKENMAENG